MLFETAEHGTQREDDSFHQDMLRYPFWARCPDVCNAMAVDLCIVGRMWFFFNTCVCQSQVQYLAYHAVDFAVGCTVALRCVILHFSFITG